MRDLCGFSTIRSFPQPAQPPTCFVHVGTHKTGTTALQRVLTINAHVFATAGILVPRTGRTDESSGHHNLAWELNGDPRFERRHGTLRDLIDEISTARASAACLSSEDFEYLYDQPVALDRIVSSLQHAGYRTVFVLYLRPQASYIESLYAELVVNHGFQRTFDEFLTTLLADGAIVVHERWRFVLDYERLIAGFAAACGPENLIVRPYHSHAPNNTHLRDFLRVVGGGTSPVAMQDLRGIERLNRAATFRDVMQRLERNRSARDGLVQTAELDLDSQFRRRFDPVHLDEARRISARFTAGNRRIGGRHGMSLPCTPPLDRLRDIAAALGLDPASRKRRLFLMAQSRADVRAAKRRARALALRRTAAPA